MKTCEQAHQGQPRRYANRQAHGRRKGRVHMKEKHKQTFCCPPRLEASRIYSPSPFPLLFPSPLLIPHPHNHLANLFFIACSPLSPIYSSYPIILIYSLILVPYAFFLSTFSSSPTFSPCPFTLISHLSF